MNYQIHKITIETCLGEDPELDASFFSYLDEYSITHTLTEDKGESGYPMFEYSGGPISLSNMLVEKFGIPIEEIPESYPNLSRF